MGKFDVKDPSRIRNIEEPAFSIKVMTLGRIECVTAETTRRNNKYVKFKGSIDHVTLMPVL